MQAKRVVKEAPLVSISMLTYNHERYIRQALDSILMQKVNFRYEIVVGEDCSPDNTRSILLEYKAKHPDKFILLLHDKNIGMDANLKAVRALCNGKYRASLEGDDYWTDPYKLQKQIDFLERHPEFIGTAHRIKVVDENGSQKKGFWKNTYFTGTFYTLKNVQRMQMPGQTGTRVYRNIFVTIGSNILDLYDKCPVPDDRKLSLLLAIHGPIYCFDEVMSHYRWITEGHSFNSIRHKDRFDAQMKKALSLQTLAKEAFNCDLDYSRYFKYGIKSVFARCIFKLSADRLVTFVKCFILCPIKFQVIWFILLRIIKYPYKKVKKNIRRRKIKSLTILPQSLFPNIEYFQILNCGKKSVLLDCLPHTYTCSFLINGEETNIEPIKYTKAEFFKLVENTYNNAPYYESVMPILKEAFQENSNGLYMSSLKTICEYLDITTKIVEISESEISKHTSKKDEILWFNKKFGSNVFITKPCQITNHDESVIKEQGIRLFYFEPNEYEYKQFTDKFVPNLSIIDIMMFNSKKEIKDLLFDYRLKLPRKKIMVLGAGRAQIPIISLCKNYGMEVVAVSPEGNYPGFDLADKKCYADVREKERVLEFARQENISAIITDQLDNGVVSAAYVSEKMNLKGIGYDCALKFTNKSIMRKEAKKLGVDVPNYDTVATLEDACESAKKIGFPIVLKPVDSSASRGVYKVNSVKDLYKHYNDAVYYSGTGEVLIEQCVVGKEYVVDSFAYEYRCQNLIIGQRNYYELNGLFVPKATVFSDSLSADSDLERRILDINKRLVEGYGLEFGITHGEYLYDEEKDKIFLVEIAARGGGVYISSHLIPLASGVNANDLLIKSILGKSIEHEDIQIKQGASAYFCFNLPVGVISDIRNVHKLKSIHGFQMLDMHSLEVGNKIGEIKDKSMRKGPVIVFGKSRKDCYEVMKEVQRTLEIDVVTKNGVKGIIW